MNNASINFTTLFRRLIISLVSLYRKHPNRSHASITNGEASALNTFDDYFFTIRVKFHGRVDENFGEILLPQNLINCMYVLSKKYLFSNCLWF